MNSQNRSCLTLSGRSISFGLGFGLGCFGLGFEAGFFLEGIFEERGCLDVACVAMAVGGLFARRRGLQGNQAGEEIITGAVI